jgi:hypothetical protein
VQVECIPLADILSAYGACHVNLFVLDVEGGELSVLQSIDWSRVSFDVLCVEAQDRVHRTGDAVAYGYDQPVIDFLAARGYVHFGMVAHNHWFVRDGFEPISWQAQSERE